MRESGIIYFKGLNGIRALAALIVVIWHVDQLSYLFDINPKYFYLNGMASRAVDLFFVLSGFLITFLLLKEKEQYGVIDFKKFYLRRIFRIWPSYYLAVIITFLLYYFDLIEVEKTFFVSALLYIFMLANVAYSLGIHLLPIAPLWSVGVEEQFYAFWPFVVSKLKNLGLVFVSIFVIGALIRIIFVYYYLNQQSDIVDFLYYFRINIMAMGALGAYWLYEKSNYLKYIYRKDVQIIAWSVLFISIFYKPPHLRVYIDAEINSVFYLIIILNVASNSNSIFNLENKLFNFLGRISYGIYVYHMLLINVMAIIFKKIDIKLNYLSVQLILISTTILVSYLSYNYFETYFLNKKKKYMKVKSTN
jgi:peptidoglycan/LPS O-acetylase OafA/YrhL